MSIALLFPGQGSQEGGHGRRFSSANSQPPSKSTHAAEAELGAAFLRACFEGPAAALNDTATAQPALYVHSVALWEAICAARPDFAPAFAAGHSLGEFSALTAAGALEFGAGLRLVRRRGELMPRRGESSPGGMAALLGLEVAAARALLKSVREEHGGTIVIANDNLSRTSGHQRRPRHIGNRLRRGAGGGRAPRLALNVSVATHSPLMASAAADFCGRLG